jgi:hypothetical protein
MSDVRPIADPVVFEGAFPKTSKPFLGNIEVIDEIVTGLMAAARDFARGAMKSNPPADLVSTYRRKVDDAKAILTGQNPAYESTDWHRSGGLVRHLAERYSMVNDPDPLGGYLAKIGVDTVKLYKAWQLDQITDAECETRLEALKTEATRDLMSLPDDKAS